MKSLCIRLMYLRGLRLYEQERVGISKLRMKNRSRLNGEFVNGTKLEVYANFGIYLNPN